MTAKQSSKTKTPLTKQIEKYQRVALMLQGGGALGSYQLGVYRALAEVNCHLNWICGVSIGAINGAIIAGNLPENRVAKLEEFWNLITHAAPLAQMPYLDALQNWNAAASRLMTITMGQPGFFRPHFSKSLFNPWTALAGNARSTSMYDTSDLKATLEKLVDFDLLNSGVTRLSVGAVNVETGNNIFFDTNNERLSPEHIMASGALPPALPFIKIGDAHYWDGGIVSNTPLQHLLDQDDDLSTLVFQVDLFNAKGTLPKQMDDVTRRQRDIVYSSRTRHATSSFKRVLSLRRQLADALKRVPAKQLRAGEAAMMHDYADAGVINIIELIYEGNLLDSEDKDFGFAVETMHRRAAAGYADTVASLAQPHWLDMPDAHAGVVEHDIHRV